MSDSTVASRNEEIQSRIVKYKTGEVPSPSMPSKTNPYL